MSERKGFIPFTQFFRPSGRPSSVEFVTTTDNFPEEVEDMAWKLIQDEGVRFEIEVLTTGKINMEAMLNGEALAGEVCSNGPDVVTSIEKLVKTAHDNLYR